MARWKLMSGHYLNTENGTRWEYTELDRGTGKQVRKQFDVPRLLDPSDPSDWTEWTTGQDGKPFEGLVVLCDGNGAKGRDIIYKGPPTPDMEPMDEEAEAITAQFRPNWNYGVGEEPGSYAVGLIDKMQSELATLQANAKPQQMEIPGLTDFMKAMTEVMAQNAALMAQLAKPERRA